MYFYLLFAFVNFFVPGSLYMRCECVFPSQPREKESIDLLCAEAIRSVEIEQNTATKRIRLLFLVSYR